MSTHCPYCAFQCGVRLVDDDATGGANDARVLRVVGDRASPVSRGALCVKGHHAAATLAHPERVTTPLVRDEHGVLVPATWDDALAIVTRALAATRALSGADAVGVFGSGALTNEKAYLLGKLARVALGTSNIDYNGRFCMSSAATAANMAFGLDRGLPFPVEDIAEAEVVLVVGGNFAETMPPIMQYFERQRASGGSLIVVDPRRTPMANASTLHLDLTPGTDAALANGILHVLVRDGLIDERYIAARTEGWDAVKAMASSHWPERVERITGVAEARIVEAAHLLGRAKSAIVLTGRGPEQQTQGVANTLAFIDVALAIGAVGKRGSGFGCVTGQGNGQGGREHGQKCDQLPGYRKIDDPEARRHVAEVWGVHEDEIPGKGKSAYELLESLGKDVRALVVVGSNVLVSTPNANAIERRLRALDFLVVVDFFVSETAALADVVLPSAQWAEEDGTMTTLEGRVIRRRRAVAPPPEVRTDLEIFCAIAAGLGKAHLFESSDPEIVFDELRRASAGGVADYAGITYERIDREQGVFWPCPSENHPGTPRLFAERFATPNRRARFHAALPAQPAEPPDDAYPLYLTTGRLLAHYQSGTQTRRVRALDAMAPAPHVEIHPSTARRHGVSEGDDVRVETRRGAAIFAAKITRALREDTVFVPFHWGGAQSVNRLTSPALDPLSKMPELKLCAARIARHVAEGGLP
jgi:assimilatory nitrate reductase catalytic subunit